MVSDVDLLQPYPDIRKSSDDVSVFICLLFISINLFFASWYSIYRENYALDPDYLKRTRSILVINTLLQIICFGGYWLNIYIMYESMWIIWLTLSTFSIMEMGIKFGESYIILVTPNYSLKDHNKIPNKYIICTYLFWFIGFCVDLIGTILGIISKDYQVQSICYALYECGRIIAVIFVIHILQSIRNKFKYIIIKRQTFKEEQEKIKQRSRLIKQSKKSKKSKISNKQKRKKKQKKVMSNTQHRNKPKKQKRSKPIPENYADDDDEKYDIAFSVGESLKRIDESSNETNSILLTHTITSSTGSQWLNKSQSTSITTKGSINDTLLSNTGIIMQSEMKRMRNLIYGLYVLIFVFLLNALFNVVFSFLSKKSNDNQLYINTPTWVVAGIFFPQWTVINFFVMMFSWIPRSQMTEDWDDA